MKKFNIILLLLCCLTSVGYAQVLVGNKAEPEEGIQSKGYLPGDGYTFQHGDTIIIKQDAINYLTGEKMSNWVYTVRHLVEKQGGKRFPDGVLVQGIISWVPAKDLYLSAPVNGQASQFGQNGQYGQSGQGGQYGQGAQNGQYGQNQLGTNAGAVAHNGVVRDTIYINQEIHDTAYVHDTVKVKFNTRYGINRFSIGVRGGLASILHGSNVVDDKLGFDAYLDLQYAHYWKQGDKAAIGLLLGGSFGFLRGGLKGTIHDQYQVPTADGTIQYTIDVASIDETQDQVMVEVPVMLSIVTDNGFFLNVGPRVSFPIWTQSKLTITDPTIDAYFIEEDVHVINETITGKVAADACKNVKNWKAPTLNVLIGAELGYEFPLKSGNALGLGLYGNYGVYSLYSKPDASQKSLIPIQVPTATPGAEPAVVKVVSPSDVYTSKMGMFDVGLKLTYHIQWKKLTL